MVCSGLFSAFGHYFMIEAFRHAEAVIVSPFRYLTIVWAITLGYVVWGDFPEKHVIGGVILVICCGLYILHREIVVRRQRRQAKG